MSDQGGVTIPAPAGHNGYGIDRTVDRVGGCDVLAIGGPGTSSEVCGERGIDEGVGNGSLEDEVVNRIVSGVVLGGGCESEHLDRAIVAGGSKILVGGVKGDAFDMTGVVGDCL